MKKIIVVLAIIIPFLAGAKEIYFYSGGKKIFLEKNFSHSLHSSETPAYRLLKGSTVRTNKNLFVKIPGTPDISKAEKWCRENNMKLIKRFNYIPEWYLVSYSGDTISKSVELIEKKIVEQSEPSFYLPLELKTYVPADEHFFKQWHLHNWGGTADGLTGDDHAHVAEAWTLMRHFTGKMGEGIKLAIIDDGFDLDHEDLAGKFLPGYDFGDKDDLPYPGPQDAHGTCCAGVAAAKTDNNLGVAGACPDCMIIPIRMNMKTYSLDSVAIESFEWAANAGADIISNSWGPADGGGAVDMGQPLKDLVTNLTTSGRDGKGIIILFAAGNGSESIEGDGFASNANVFAIGASTAAGKRSSYSDFGMSLDFLAPSNDTDSSGDGWSGSYVDGIWTTDNTNGGYNPGQLAGDTTGKYVSEFGGTSSACPLAAGITGLVLSANPDLTRDQVYDIFKTTADKVSKGAVNPGENDYDANGFSTHYGYGRLNACEAVKKAFEMAGKDVADMMCGDDIEQNDSDKPENDSDNPANDQEQTNDNEVTDDSNLEDDDVTPVGKRADDGCSCSFLNI
jgi:hypothetical protein